MKFAMIALGREHSNDELKPFRQRHKFTFPMAGDIKRAVFSRYADAYIPRSLLVDPNGRWPRRSSVTMKRNSNR